MLVEMTVTLTQDQDQKVPLRTERTGRSTGSGRVGAWGLHARQVAVRRRGVKMTNPRLIYKRLQQRILSVERDMQKQRGTAKEKRGRAGDPETGDW